MEKVIKETTEKLSSGIINKQEANEILLKLFNGYEMDKEDWVPVDEELTWLDWLIGAFKNRRY